MLKVFEESRTQYTEMRLQITTTDRGCIGGLVFQPRKRHAEDQTDGRRLTGVYCTQYAANVGGVKLESSQLFGVVFQRLSRMANAGLVCGRNKDNRVKVIQRGTSLNLEPSTLLMPPVS